MTRDRSVKMITCGKLRKIIDGLVALPSELKSNEIKTLLSNARHDVRNCSGNKDYTYRNKF